MTDSERLRVGIALSLFAHFCFFVQDWPHEAPRPAFSTRVTLNMESAAVTPGGKAGLGIDSPTPEAQEQARLADMKRKAFLRFLTEVDDAVHERRFEAGTADLIGVAVCQFVITPEGAFEAIRLASSSGNDRLDAAALHAVHAASGVVKRPAIIGSNPIPVTLQVKYQYGLK